MQWLCTPLQGRARVTENPRRGSSSQDWLTAPLPSPFPFRQGKEGERGVNRDRRAVSLRKSAGKRRRQNSGGRTALGKVRISILDARSLGDISLSGGGGEESHYLSQVACSPPLARMASSMLQHKRRHLPHAHRPNPDSTEPMVIARPPMATYSPQHQESAPGVRLARPRTSPNGQGRHTHSTQHIMYNNQGEHIHSTHHMTYCNQGEHIHSTHHVTYCNQGGTNIYPSLWCTTSKGSTHTAPSLWCTQRPPTVLPECPLGNLWTRQCRG